MADVPLSVNRSIVTAALGTFAYFEGGSGFRPRWREAIEYVKANRLPGDAIYAMPRRICRYYFEDVEVLDRPDGGLSLESLNRLNRRTWIVFRAESATVPSRYSWAQDHLELKRYYDSRIIQPFSSVRVYLFDPARH